MSAVLDQMGYTGQNQSLDLTWSGAPPNTKSYAITLRDPDVPGGVGFVCRLLFDIPAHHYHHYGVLLGMAKATGRQHLDWSAQVLGAAEAAGLSPPTSVRKREEGRKKVHDGYDSGAA